MILFLVHTVHLPVQLVWKLRSFSVGSLYLFSHDYEEAEDGSTMKEPELPEFCCSGEVSHHVAHQEQCLHDRQVKNQNFLGSD